MNLPEYFSSNPFFLDNTKGQGNVTPGYSVDWHVNQTIESGTVIYVVKTRQEGMPERERGIVIASHPKNGKWPKVKEEVKR